MVLCHRISVLHWFEGTQHIYIQWLRGPKKISSWTLESTPKSYLAFWFVVGWCPNHFSIHLNLIHSPWSYRQYGSLRSQYKPNILHCVKTKKTTITWATPAMIIWKLMSLILLLQWWLWSRYFRWPDRGQERGTRIFVDSYSWRVACYATLFPKESWGNHRTAAFYWMERPGEKKKSLFLVWWTLLHVTVTNWQLF